ncbi:MAG: hypothetical protein ACYC61_18865 [Isosphaeraceae bacterium]
MPSPVYSAGTPGNVISNLPVAKSSTVAAFLDISTCVEGQVTCEMATGATAPTAPTTFGAYKAYAAGASAPITLTAPVTAGAVSLPLSGAVGLHQNQKVALIAAATGRGEIVTLAAAPAGTAAQSIACSATLNAYAANDEVYLMVQVASSQVSPSSPANQSWSANTDYSGEMFLGPAQWVIGINNTDTAQSVTVSATVDKITAIQ